jgi:hypothetical protein
MPIWAQIEGRFTLITDMSVTYQYRPSSAQDVWTVLFKIHVTLLWRTPHWQHWYVIGKCESPSSAVAHVTCLSLFHNQVHFRSTHISNRAQNNGIVGYSPARGMKFARVMFCVVWPLRNIKMTFKSKKVQITYDFDTERSYMFRSHTTIFRH